MIAFLLPWHKKAASLVFLNFNKTHPILIVENISEAPPGEPLPSVSISVAFLHLHELGEKGSVPDHLDNFIHASNNLAGRQAILYLPLHNSLVLGFMDTRTTLILFTTIMINYLDMVSEHVELGIVQFHRLLFDCLQGM